MKNMSNRGRKQCEIDFVKNKDIDYYSCCFHCRLRGAKNTVVRDYVLPDYTHIKRGYVKVNGITFKFVDCGG